MDKLYRYIDHRNCKMLPSNATVGTPATTISSRRCLQTSYLKGPLSLAKIKVKSTSTLRILLLYVNQSLKSLNQTVFHLDTVDQR